MTRPAHRYRSSDEDSARWTGFEHRPGDIVISTRSKHGTTWMQMICALMVFRTPDLPAPLSELSPWLDWLVLPRSEVVSALEAQRHRRFIKTHTPLDGLPITAGVTYVVVARDPLDAAVSLWHQGANLDRQRLAELTGSPTPPPAQPAQTVEEWLDEWVRRDASPQEDLDSLPGVFWHLSDAWKRRGVDDVVLVHYQDLLDDLPGEMARHADRLGVDVMPGEVQSLASAARFDAMRRDSTRLAPDPAGVLVDTTRFFRAGRSGAGRSMLDQAALDIYEQRATELAPPDLLAWLHR